MDIQRFLAPFAQAGLLTAEEAVEPKVALRVLKEIGLEKIDQALPLSDTDRYVLVGTFRVQGTSVPLAVRLLEEKAVERLVTLFHIGSSPQTRYWSAQLVEGLGFHTEGKSHEIPIWAIDVPYQDIDPLVTPHILRSPPELDRHHLRRIGALTPDGTIVFKAEKPEDLVIYGHIPLEEPYKGFVFKLDYARIINFAHHHDGKLPIEIQSRVTIPQGIRWKPPLEENDGHRWDQFLLDAWEEFLSTFVPPIFTYVLEPEDQEILRQAEMRAREGGISQIADNLRRLRTLIHLGLFCSGCTEISAAIDRLLRGTEVPSVDLSAPGAPSAPSQVLQVVRHTPRATWLSRGSATLRRFADMRLLIKLAEPQTVSPPFSQVPRGHNLISAAAIIDQLRPAEEAVRFIMIHKDEFPQLDKESQERLQRTGSILSLVLERKQITLSGLDNLMEIFQCVIPLLPTDLAQRQTLQTALAALCFIHPDKGPRPGGGRKTSPHAREKTPFRGGTPEPVSRHRHNPHSGSSALTTGVTTFYHGAANTSFSPLLLLEAV